LPGLIESAEQGPFVEFVKALDDVYPGRINIHVYPFARSTHNVIMGKADFHLPTVRDNRVPESELPLAAVDAEMGNFHLVIYSNVDRKLTLAQLEAAMSPGREFPYRIEGIATGVRNHVAIPFDESFSVESSLLQVNAKRIDAFIHTQEGADPIVIEHRLKNIYRSRFMSYYDVVSVQKSAHGEEVNRILSECIRTLRKSGRLQEIYRRIHRPYDDWQPAEMGW
jgi:polar amino acid transport system substrate-binding protein